ncbi:hypothetical protein KTQ42_15575|uniref:DUF5677 domain-containing protein n=1 Tax=Noviherbaspirillum sp. L7-7A TaxID=2850560 RepID=UPI001C2BE40C|nr:DUF5677 domain-containing protein [Noviherbaspirillum sp. L7-7A]MBV0880721.1 hypothetical protein [Noviherbaspirillum sp. L7-7A]
MAGMIDEMQSLFDIASAGAKALVIEPQGPSHQFAAATLYGRILETSNSCLILIRAGDDVAIPIITRALLDAYVDLIILADDPQHENVLVANELHERTKLYSRALQSNGESEALDALAKAEGLAELLTSERKELDELISAGFRPIRADNRFKLAGMGSWYPTVFARLSEHVHNNLKIMKGRFLREETAGAKLIYSCKLDEPEMAMYLTIICDACVGGLLKLFVLLDVTDDDTLRLLDEKRKQVHSYLPD